MRRMLVVLATAGVLAGCQLLQFPSASPEPSGTARLCTMIGCENGVTFVLDVDLLAETAYDVEACFDGRCERQVLRVPPPTDGPFTGITLGNVGLDTGADTIRLRLGEGSFEGSHEVSVKVLLDGATLVDARATTELTPTRPNGPECEPLCWGAEVRV
ncbi:MAG TPA: hypothetical protein VFM19_02705 [Candidatus Limnocylindria bacterium]|nr:hypothetical protein [Candidatus Limnocylindria bacterium]